ncbi:carbamoyltransferase HypF [Candidatus Latescibacterota bacterium]
MKSKDHTIETIEVTGIVQGVGFRPFVHNLAVKHNLCGYVLNGPEGVVIEIEGRAGAIEDFLYDLEHNAPPLSRIMDILRKKNETLNETDYIRPRFTAFEIRDSLHEGKPVTLISPDVCVCDDCISELFDPENRRHLYPFINCTNCGPRFTIIRGLPYDRPYTTMSDFNMCPDCLREYENPHDRRFHAQPNACEICGPRLELLDSEGHPVGADPVASAVNMLKDGLVVAVKGLGGFHLVVDGSSDDAVKRLRQRKHRDEKPLAIMTGTLEDADRIVRAGEVEKQILGSIERPILLAHKRENTVIAESVAPDNNYLGVMLPYTPLHYLLFFDPSSGGNYEKGRTVFPALVMTSGNLSEEPICKDNDEALDRLYGIADAFLVHNRDIHVRSDDSVVRIADGEASFLRRSRGYVPVPVFLNDRTPPVLALGAELKNTICITEGKRAFTSQHIGDMENITTLDFFHEAVSHFKKILEIEPGVFAYDLHPGYLSSKYFKQIEEEFEDSGRRFGSVGVQHHHAHIASVLAEHGHDGPVIGLSWDGTGYGLDDTVWGGEILLATPYGFTRLAHLDYVPMPGGESAVRESWRMAFSYLSSAFEDDTAGLNLQCLKQIPADDLDILARAISSGINCPLTSSLGRFFDAAASILDIRHVSAFEGQAAIMLDMLASKELTGSVLPYDIRENGIEHFDTYPVLKGTLKNTSLPAEDFHGTGYILDYKPLVRALAEGIKSGREQSKLAYDFHLTLMSSFLDVLNRIREETNIATVALSGGCWQNRILSERIPEMLRAHGYEVLTNRLVPPNDGGLSLGQAYIAGRIANNEL